MSSVACGGPGLQYGSPMPVFGGEALAPCCNWGMHFPITDITYDGHGLVYAQMCLASSKAIRPRSVWISAEARSDSLQYLHHAGNCYNVLTAVMQVLAAQAAPHSPQALVARSSKQVSKGLASSNTYPASSSTSASSSSRSRQGLTMHTIHLQLLPLPPRHPHHHRRTQRHRAATHRQTVRLGGATEMLFSMPRCYCA